MKKDLVQNAFETIQRQDMLEKGTKLLLAVSGGPDSIFLFHALYNLRSRLGVELYIANLDHGIRKDASKADSRFVEELSRKFSISFVHKRIDPAVYKRSKLSKEEIAREKRYEFLISSAKKLDIRTIAMGHTIDDQAETVLMRIIKGASLKGLVGIPAARYEQGIKIIRPLINISKQDIVKYLKDESISYRIDGSNQEDIYLRNKVRNRVLPYLEKYNPRIKHALTNLAQSLREDFEFIEEEKRKRTQQLFSNGDEVCLSLKDIIVQPKALRKEILRDTLSKAGSNIKKLSYRHWQDMDDFIKRRQKGKCIDLPGDVRIKKTQDSLVFYKRK